MSNCQDGRFNCGPTVASACVPYTGQQLGNVDYTTLACQPNINDILTNLDNAITLINNSISIGNLDYYTFPVPQPNDVSATLQLILTQLILITTQLSSLQTQVNSINVLNEQFNVDLSCLFGGANCNPTNLYTLGYILTVLIQQVCNLKAQINQ